MTEMVGLAQRVESLPCAHDLEAAVRELRLIAQHKPRYNRRSRFPERLLWVRLTDDAFPRLSVVRGCARGRGSTWVPSPTAGPPTPRSPRSTTPCRCASAAAGSPLADPPRVRPGRHGPVRRPVHRCAVPGRVRRHRRRAGGRGRGRPGPAVRTAAGPGRPAGHEGRYEDAAVLRDRLAVLVRALRRRQRLALLAEVPELTIARPDAPAAGRCRWSAAAGWWRPGWPPAARRSAATCSS